jgi:hypothetical protein
MTARLTPTAVDRLAKLCGMFGSHHDGEVSNAARLADTLVRDLGLTWRDVIKMPPRAPPAITDWRTAARFCCANQDRLSARELDFIATLARWRGEPTAKQTKWLEDIVARLRRAA